MKLFKIAVRSLVHYKLYSFINVLGLTLSLTCMIIIFRYVYSELTTDRFNRNLDRIFITTMERDTHPGRLQFGGIYNPNREPAFVDLSKNPGVEKHALFIPMVNNRLQIDNREYTVKLMIADSCFLQILDFPLATGQRNLSRPEDAFVSEDFARKVFGDENPVGRKLHYPDMNKELTIVGVIGKPATQGAISFDVLISYHLVNFWVKRPNSLILLYPSVDYKQFNRQYAGFIDMAKWQEQIRYQLYPYKDLYFENEIWDHGSFKHGKSVYVFILSAVGALLLLIGIVNYINIHTVVVLRRNKEYGMKKVFGAESGKVFFQLFLENLYLMLLSLIFSFVFADMLNPAIEKIFGIEQFPDGRFDGLLSVLLAVLLPAVTTIAPFLRYNYSPPVVSLRVVNTGGKLLFMRQFFLAFQYFITLTMITVSLFFVKQLHFMLHHDLGYRTKNIIKAPFLPEEDMATMSLSVEEFKAFQEKNEKVADELKQKMNASTLFEDWTFGSFPSEARGRTFEFRTPNGEWKSTLLMNVDETWLRLFEIQLLQGRLWDNGSDSFYNYVGIVGESLLRQFEITDYETAELEPRKRLWWSSTRKEEMSQNPPYRIVGVIKDFYTDHLSQKQPPTLFTFSGVARPYYPVVASFAPEHRKEVIAFLHKLHDELIGGEFTYSFIEDEIEAIYKEDRRIAVIYSVFTGIAILISILGLFGISLFDIRQRRKEIAIRKVNGALTQDIARLLLKRYFVLLSLAFIISLPVAGFAMHKYLESFAFQTPVSWWLFAVSGIITSAVSLLTLVWQIRKACSENPAEVVKTE